MEILSKELVEIKYASKNLTPSARAIALKESLNKPR